MRVETRIARILESDATQELKISRLQTLALRCFAASPQQKQVIALYKNMEAGKAAELRPIEEFYSK